MRNEKVQKLTLTSLLLATAVLIPSMFHLLSSVLPGAGKIFLPMHIPVLIAGLLLGPYCGFAVGICAPIINSLATGMPPMAKVPFMTVELAAYGLFAGIFYRTLKMNRIKIKIKNKDFDVGIYIALLISLVLGRCVNALALIVGTYILHIECGAAVTVIYSAVTGLPGIIIQFVLIPPLVKAVDKFLEKNPVGYKKFRAKELEKAKNILKKDEKLTLTLVNGKKTFTSEERGVNTLLNLIQSNPETLKNAFVADKVTGKASAFLLISGGISALYSEVLSEKAEDVLKKYGVYYEYGEKVPNIINRAGDGICPMEEATLNCEEPNEAIEAIKEKLKELSN